MKRAAAILAKALFCISVALVNSASAQSTGKQIFILEDAEHHQWCSYRTESEWTAEVKSLTSMVVGTLEYLGDHISKISLTEEDETGDWIVYDHYAVDDKEEIRELKRTINVLPGDRTEEETYLVLDGKAKKQSSNSRRLSTKDILPAQQEQDWLPKVPIVTRLQDFPFKALISGKHVKPSSGDKVCVPVK